MTDTFERFIINNAVTSKLAETPLVGDFEGTKIVFVRGYPMTLRGFYTLTTKAVLGATFRMNMKTWEGLHQETKLLCEPLKMELHEDREAYSVVQGIRKSLNWTKETYEPQKIYKWVEQVEKLMQEKE